MKKILSAFLAVSMLFSLSAQNSPARRAYVDFVVIPSHSDAVYNLGDAAALKVVAQAGGKGLENVKIHFTAGPDRMPADTSGVTTFCNGEALLSFGTMTQPGFRYCKLSFEVEGESYREEMKVAFAPEQILPTIANPADFDAFWAKTLKQAAKVPMEVEIVPLPEKSSDKVKVSMVKIQCYEKGNYVYGYLQEPNDGLKHPVMLHPPGAGVKRINPTPWFAQEGFITLTIGINGIPMDATDEEIKAKQVELNRGDYAYIGLESKEQYYYRKVYAALVRCIDFLVSLPNFDGVNVGVTGGSQGGALSIVAAALDPRIDFLASFYPALCDLSGYAYGNRAGGWPRMLAPGSKRELSVSVDQMFETLAYYDVLNFARRIKVPGFYSYGYNDNTCPPTSVCAAINQVTAPKVIEITPSSAHWRFNETNVRANAWMRAQCK
ncbi:MAG: acetylxylan esterase [Bacteroidales bacterium]|nr:acetylxylan esterase [Bacteroidales bacterium]